MRQLRPRSMFVLALLVGCGEEATEAPPEPEPAVAEVQPESEPEMLDLDELEFQEADASLEEPAPELERPAPEEPEAEPEPKPRPKRSTRRVADNAIQPGPKGDDQAAAAKAAARAALAEQERRAKEARLAKQAEEEAAQQAERARRVRVGQEAADDDAVAEVQETPEEREARLKAEAEAAEKARLAKELWEKHQAELAAKRAAEERERELAYQKASVEWEAKQQAREEAQRKDLDQDCLPFELDERSLAGELTDKERVCLEISVQTISRRVDREDLSVVLIQDAHARDDRAKWASLVERHLTEINPDDAGLAYRMALHTWAGSTGDAADTLTWVEAALENRAIWTGETYDRRVGDLLGLRAAASQNLWKQTVSDESLSGDERERAVRRARKETYDAALEWYAFSQKDSALALCKLAAEREGACQATLR